eukprot:7854667-Alexandrium_andersonii.AAC.1
MPLDPPAVWPEMREIDATNSTGLAVLLSSPGRITNDDMEPTVRRLSGGPLMALQRISRTLRSRAELCGALQTSMELCQAVQGSPELDGARLMIAP